MCGKEATGRFQPTRLCLASRGLDFRRRTFEEMGGWGDAPDLRLVKGRFDGEVGNFEPDLQVGNRSEHGEAVADFACGV
ncbi:MAG: hypothetical protein H0V75_13595 [Rubrobacter sp.]|nr:hypothetical protein [Rubrobacter sp.]